MYDITRAVADAYMQQERTIRITLFPKTRPSWIQEYHFDMISTVFYPIYCRLRHSEFQCLMLLFVNPNIPSNWDENAPVITLGIRYMFFSQGVDFTCYFS